MQKECCGQCKYQRRDLSCGFNITDGSYPIDAACASEEKQKFIVRGALFRHYKGGIYTVIGLAYDSSYHDSIAPGAVMVVYFSPTDGNLYYRELKAFLGTQQIGTEGLTETFAYVSGPTA